MVKETRPQQILESWAEQHLVFHDVHTIGSSCYLMVKPPKWTTNRDSDEAALGIQSCSGNTASNSEIGKAGSPVKQPLFAERPH